MWGQVTAEELQQVKDQIRVIRAAMVLRHAQELGALDAEVADMDLITGLLEGFAQKYRGRAAPEEPTQEQQQAANTDPGQGVNREHELGAVETYSKLRSTLGR